MAKQQIPMTGEKFSWKGAGKVARAFGYAGKAMTGTVTDVRYDETCGMTRVSVTLDPELIAKYDLPEMGGHVIYL